MPAQDRPYDIKLDSHPYLLARDKDGSPQWAVETVGSAIGQQSSTESRYSPLASTIELPMVWDSFHRGFGDEEKLDEARYYYGQNLDCRFEGKVFPALALNTLELPTGTEAGHILKFVELGNQLFAVNDRYAFYINAAQNEIETSYDFGATVRITDACTFGEEIIVARGHQADSYSLSSANIPRWGRTAKWWKDETTPDAGDYSLGSGTWGHIPTVAAAWGAMSGIYLGYLTNYGDRLAATTSDYEVRWVGSGATISTAGNWCTPYVIGDRGFEITSLGELAGLLYVGKRDGLYALGGSEDGKAIQIAPELRAPAHADNCRNMRAWHGYLWVPHQRGFFAYRSLGSSGFTVTSCSLGSRAGQSSPVRGLVTAMTGDDRWLYAALWTGEDTYILAGREIRNGEDAYAPLIWHTLWHLPDERVYSMHIGATGNTPRLWLGVAGNIRYVDLPYGTDNPMQDTSCTYETDGTLYLSRHSWAAPSTRKLFKSVEIMADNLQNSQHIDVYYRLDGRQRWHAVGEYPPSNRATMSPRHVLSFGQTGVVGRRIELKLVVHASSTINPPIIRAVVVRAAERPVAQEIITAVVRCSDNLPTRTGGRFPDTGATQLARLKALTTERAVQLDDMVDYKRFVIVLSPINEAVSKQENTATREVLATVRMTPFAAEEMPEITGVGIYGQSKWGTVADGGTGETYLNPDE